MSSTASSNIVGCNGELENLLTQSLKKNDMLVEELEKKNLIVKEQIIKLKALEEQISTTSQLSEVDFENLQSQLKYKDQRIVELNTVILEKERHILDLQEQCREQGEVANVKSQAMRLVQKKFEEIECKETKEVSTETESYHGIDSRKTLAPIYRSPGHAVVRDNSGGSPPPLDPSEVDEDDIANRNCFSGPNLDKEITLRKRQKKRVTFDLPPSSCNRDSALEEEYQLRLSHIMQENDAFRNEIEILRDTANREKVYLIETLSEKEAALKDAKQANLKNKAVTQSRIRELEEKMADISANLSQKIECMQYEIDTLRNSRDWEVKQNGHLREEVVELRNKIIRITNELDESARSNRSLNEKLQASLNLEDTLIQELTDAESIVLLMEDQKHSILDDVDRLKDALCAQDNLIEVLEADIVIYEQHIGILRESLGASKVDHRSIIRSRAFETKLKALELEKEQINRKSTEDKLRSKSLALKVKTLEEENEKLVEKLCEAEMLLQDQNEIENMRKQVNVLVAQEQEKFAVEKEKLISQIDYLTSLESEMLTKSNTIETLSNEVNELKCMNFDLKQSIENIDSMRTDEYDLRAQIKYLSEEIESEKSNNVSLFSKIKKLSTALEGEKELTANIKERNSVLEKELDSVSIELGHARINLIETNAVKLELEKIRSELDYERLSDQAKWEELRKKWEEEELHRQNSRKNSIEINELCTTPYIEKIALLEQEIHELHEIIEAYEQRRPKHNSNHGELDVMEAPEPPTLAMKVENVALSNKCELFEDTKTLEDFALKREHVQSNIIEKVTTGTQTFEESTTSILNTTILCSNVEGIDISKNNSNVNNLLKYEDLKAENDETQVGRLVSENIILRQCVNDSVKTQDDIYQDLEKLCELKSELETTVEALKGEIWCLNSQLKTAFKNCSNLEDRSLKLEASLVSKTNEFDELKLRFLDETKIYERSKLKLSSQKLEIDNLRQQAEEDVLNRLQLESAYNQLNKYYEELQTAYNDLYANSLIPDSSTEQLQNNANTGPLANAELNNFCELLNIEVDEISDVEKKKKLIMAISHISSQVTLFQEAFEEQKKINNALSERLVGYEEEQNNMCQEQEKSDDTISTLKDEILVISKENKKMLEQRQSAEENSAKLTTKQADVDALFRANSEMAYKNMELDIQAEELRKEKHIAESEIVNIIHSIREFFGESEDYENNEDHLVDSMDLLELNVSKLLKFCEKIRLQNKIENCAQNQNPLIEGDKNDWVGDWNMPNTTPGHDLSYDKTVCKAVRDAHNALILNFGKNEVTLDISDNNSECEVEQLGVEIKRFIDTCSNSMSKFASENNCLSREYQSLTDKLKISSEENTTIRAKIEKLENSNTEYKNAIGVMKVKENTIAEEIQELKRKLLQCENESSNTAAHISKLELQNELLQDSEMKLLNIVDDFTKRIEKLSEAEVETQCYKDKIEQMKSDVEEYRSRLLRSENSMNTLRASNEKLKQDLSEKVGMIEGLNTELELLKKKRITSSNGDTHELLKGSDSTTNAPSSSTSFQTSRVRNISDASSKQSEYSICSQAKTELSTPQYASSFSSITSWADIPLLNEQEKCRRRMGSSGKNN